MTPAPDNQMHQTRSPVVRKLVLKLICFQLHLTLTKKTQPNFLQTKKDGNNFYHSFDDFFPAFMQRVSITILDKHKVISDYSGQGLMFNCPAQTRVQFSIHIYLCTTSDKKPYLRIGDKKLTAEKENLLVNHRGNAVSNFPKLFFIVKQVVLLCSGINLPLTKVIFSQVFAKANCTAFKDVSPAIGNRF